MKPLVVLSIIAMLLLLVSPPILILRVRVRWRRRLGPAASKGTLESEDEKPTNWSVMRHTSKSMANNRSESSGTGRGGLLNFRVEIGSSSPLDGAPSFSSKTKRGLPNEHFTYDHCAVYQLDQLHPASSKATARSAPWLRPSSLRARYFFNDTNCSAVGGWTSSWEHSYPLYSTRCDIDRVNASLITRAEFDRYYRGKRPVIFLHGTHLKAAGRLLGTNSESPLGATPDATRRLDFARRVSRAALLRLGNRHIVTGRAAVKRLDERELDKGDMRVAGPSEHPLATNRGTAGAQPNRPPDSVGRVARGQNYRLRDYIRKMDRPWLSSVVPPEDTDYVSGKTPFGEPDVLQKLAQDFPIPEVMRPFIRFSQRAKDGGTNVPSVDFAKLGNQRAGTHRVEEHQVDGSDDDVLHSGWKAYRIFLLGGVGSGATWHLHPGAWSTTWYGLKRWFFRPGVPHPSSAFSTPEPTSAGYRGNTTIQWLFHEGPSGYANVRRHEDELVSKGIVQEPQFFECVSVPGETVYVPDMWWHATLNIGQMVSTTHIEVSVPGKT